MYGFDVLRIVNLRESVRKMRCRLANPTDCLETDDVLRLRHLFCLVDNYRVAELFSSKLRKSSPVQTGQFVLRQSLRLFLPWEVLSSCAVLRHRWNIELCRVKAQDSSGFIMAICCGSPAMRNLQEKKEYVLIFWLCRKFENGQKLNSQAAKKDENESIRTQLSPGFAVRRRSPSWRHRGYALWEVLDGWLGPVHSCVQRHDDTALFRLCVRQFPSASRW